MAGYSGTPLIRKLGLKQGFRATAIGAPPTYLEDLGDLPPGVRFDRLSRTGNDFIHLFVTARAELERQLPRLKARLERDGMLWVSWPKKSSDVPTDLSGNVVRELGLAAGLVDIKVCAVDETWSALKFVYRLRDRGRLPKP